MANFFFTPIVEKVGVPSSNFGLPTCGNGNGTTFAPYGMVLLETVYVGWGWYFFPPYVGWGWYPLPLYAGTGTEFLTT